MFCVAFEMYLFIKIILILSNIRFMNCVEIQISPITNKYTLYIWLSMYSRLRENVLYSRDCVCLFYNPPAF